MLCGGSCCRVGVNRYRVGVSQCQVGVSRLRADDSLGVCDTPHTPVVATTLIRPLVIYLSFPRSSTFGILESCNFQFSCSDFQIQFVLICTFPLYQILNTQIKFMNVNVEEILILEYAQG